MADAINGFHGRYRFLSNFWLCDVEIEGIVFPSSEHAFQAMKTLNPVQRKLIAMASDDDGKPSPREAKRLGYQVDLRPKWHREKDHIMLDVLRVKFSDPDLAELLLATHPKPLMEGNTWGDKYWGCVFIDGEWKGKNTLGKLLVQLREELRADHS